MLKQIIFSLMLLSLFILPACGPGPQVAAPPTVEAGPAALSTLTASAPVTVEPSLPDPTLSPTVETELPTAEPDPVEADSTASLCPEIPRPALVYPADYDRYDRLLVTDLTNQATCELALDPAPTMNQFVFAAGSLFYPIQDSEAQTFTIWQLTPDGDQRPLEFTTTSAMLQFTVSADGGKIAWSPRIWDQPTVWTANLDGSELVTVVDNLSEAQQRYPLPIRFSPDNQTLYYALQPDGIGGMMFSFSGRYDTLYRVSVDGGQPALIYACEVNPPAELCVGDLSSDGSVFAYTQFGADSPREQTGDPVIHLINTADGLPITTLTPPGLDFAGFPTFSQSDDLVFISATLGGGEDFFPIPTPGYLSLLQPPYTNPPETLLVEDGLAGLVAWLDGAHILYDTADGGGSAELGIVTVGGQNWTLPIMNTVAVLQ